MTFSIGTITRCAGQNHWKIPISINGVVRTLETTVSELQDAAPEGFEESRSAIISRIRSALLEAGATTFTQSRTALESKSFKV